MVPDKRTITAACGLFAAAALALAGCAPSGYGSDGSNDSNAAPALANATGTPEPTASADSGTGGNADVALTTELKAKTIKRMGKVVANQDGFTLYLFTKDSKNPSKSTCNDKCAKIWPPALTDGNATIGGIAADLVGSVTRDDGTKQLTVGGWPAYTYLGDKAPGQWKGQGVGGTWFVLGPDGKANKTCLPKGTPTPVAPPADGGASNDGGSSSGDSGSSGSGSGDTGGGGYTY